MSLCQICVKRSSQNNNFIIEYTHFIEMFRPYLTKDKVNKKKKLRLTSAAHANWGNVNSI